MMRKSLCFLIGLYQRFISPVLPPHCRYTPSCSEYAIEAIQKHGAIKGLWLGMKRLGRCNPSLLDPTGMILYRSRVRKLRKTPMKMPVKTKPAEKKIVIASTVAGQTVNG